jgi:SAM-dependent methyltransferase
MSRPSGGLRRIAKRAMLYVARSALRRVGWDAVPASIQQSGTQNTAVVAEISEVLASQVYADLHSIGIDQDDGWRRALHTEIQFWLGFYATDGVEYGGGARARVAAKPFQYGHLFEHRPAGETLRVLDVGAGPVSHVGTLSDVWTIELDAVDPLASAYRRILDLFQLRPPVPTTFGMGEHLDAICPGRSFDLVLSINALDHARDPMTCIQQMAARLTTGGWLLLDHADREGEQHQFHGLHQWNFYVRDGHYWVESRLGKAARVEHEALRLTSRFEPYFADKPYTRVLYRLT